MTDTDNQALVVLAAQTADELGEVGIRPRLEIGLTVAALGVEGTTTVLAQAKEIHAGEGLLRGDGTRRTLGGTFFALAKKLGRDEPPSDEWGAAREKRRKAGRQRVIELAATKEALTKEKAAREKAERELAELRILYDQALLKAAGRSSAPKGRVYRAPDH